jgi:transposase
LEQHQSDIEQGQLVVLMEDECHLLWGDVCGLVWGKRNEPIEVPISNKKLRQSYYGAVNLLSGQFHLQAYEGANGANTVAYVKYLQGLYPQARLLLIWDGATYHRFAEMRDYLTEINAGLSEEAWKVTCLLFASNAPEQNPVEDIWLKGKNWLRKHFAQNKTFTQVKLCFVDHLTDKVFQSAKFSWYWPHPQII